jgi:hypothetical protein
MQNGNRYYNQPLWGIFKKTADGQIFGYVGSKKSNTSWSDKEFFVFTKKEMVYNTWWDNRYVNNFVDGDYISSLLKSKRAKVDTEDQVFITRLRSKKCPIEIIKKHIPIMKYPGPSGDVLQFKKKYE